MLLLTLSDPATRNTLSHQVIAAGIEALDAAEADDSLRCIVLCGDAVKLMTPPAVMLTVPPVTAMTCAVPS